jgi:hypothetical protein
MYKMYRKMPSGKWKYVDAFNSTLDPYYHEMINFFRAERIEWELRDFEGKVKFKNEDYEIY